MSVPRKSVKENYSLSGRSAGRLLPAPRMPYRPPRAKNYRPRIGLIGCGGISGSHLQAYRKARYEVVALTDLEPTLANEKRDRFYRQADVLPTAADLLARPDIDIVDITTHPEERVELMREAIRAGKHILSQKPFVIDLDVGRELVRRARRRGLRLAVNQNGRWAPYVAYARQAIAAGLLGRVTSVDLSVHWDHNWVAGRSFDLIRHLVLFDFGIHWFDMLHCYLPRRRARSVFATTGRTPMQVARPALLAQVLIDFDDAQASLSFRADTRYGAQDRTVIVGSQGTLVSTGPNINEQTVTLWTEKGMMRPKLAGRWFNDGFDGTMSELICAIEENREPFNSAEDCLSSLEMCFAAIHSAEEGIACRPGSVSHLHPEWITPADRRERR